MDKMTSEANVEEGRVKSAARVVEILELFDTRQCELSIQEMVEALSLPQSSVSSLVKTLVMKGFLSRTENGRRFTLSERLAFLGHWTLGTSRSMEAIQVLMGRLSETIGESTLLGCQSGLLMRYVGLIESPHHLRFTLSPNDTRPMQSCGLGIMLLSRMEDDVIASMIRRFNSEFPDHPLKRTESEVMADVSKARAQAYFETFGIVTAEVGTISTLLPLPRSERTLAIGIGGPLSRLDRKREWLRETLMSEVARTLAED